VPGALGRVWQKPRASRRGGGRADSAIWLAPAKLDRSGGLGARSQFVRKGRPSPTLGKDKYVVGRCFQPSVGSASSKLWLVATPFCFLLQVAKGRLQHV
jgi:hypothetical protein